MFDLKTLGTAVFIDLARRYALAHGIAETGTRSRLEAVARLPQVPAREGESWSSAFEFLQLLRLQVQLGPGAVANTMPAPLDHRLANPWGDVAQVAAALRPDVQARSLGDGRDHSPSAALCATRPRRTAWPLRRCC